MAENYPQVDSVGERRECHCYEDSDTTARKQQVQKLIGDIKRKMNPHSSSKGPSTKKSLKHGRHKKHKLYIGWLHAGSSDAEYKAIRLKHGGGVRSTDYNVDEPQKVSDLLAVAKSLFFPNGENAMGSINDMHSELGTYTGNAINEFLDMSGNSCSFQDYLKCRGLYSSRHNVYLLTRETGVPVTSHQIPFSNDITSEVNTVDGSQKNCSGDTCGTDYMVISGTAEKPVLNIKYRKLTESSFSEVITQLYCHSLADCKNLSFSAETHGQDFNALEDGFEVISITKDSVNYLDIIHEPSEKFIFPRRSTMEQVVIHGPSEIFGYELNSSQLLLGIVASCHGHCEFIWFKDGSEHHRGDTSALLPITETGVYSVGFMFKGSLFLCDDPVHVVSQKNEGLSFPKQEKIQTVVKSRCTSTYMSELTNVPQLRDVPQLMDVPQFMDVPQLMDVSQLMDVKQLMDVPQPTDVKQLMDVPQPTNVKQLMDVPQPTDVKQLMDVPQPTDVKQLMDVPQPTDVKQLMDVPQSTDVKQLTDVPQLPDEPHEQSSVNVTIPLIDKTEIWGSSMKAIGEGAYGNVYRSEWNGTTVAVKEIKLKRLKLLKKILHGEIQLHGRVRHPNIVQLMAYSIDRSYIYIISEYVDGPNMDELLFGEFDGDCLSLDEKQSVSKQILMGVAYLHNLKPPIIHEDIKPENRVLHRQNLVAKLCDFGVSRVKAIETATKTAYNTSETPGTPLYQAPEIILDKKKSSTASDVWSLSCTFVEIVNRKKTAWCIEDHELGNIIEFVCNEMLARNMPRAYILLDKNVPQPITEIIGRGLNYDSVRRPSCIEMLRVYKCS